MIELCNLNTIEEDGSKGFQVNELAVFAIRKQQEVYLYLNSCPHLGIELEWEEDRFLDSEAMHIQCSTHGALFVIETGLCVAGPCLREKLTPIPCTVRDNIVYITALPINS